MDGHDRRKSTDSRLRQVNVFSPRGNQVLLLTRFYNCIALEERMSMTYIIFRQFVMHSRIVSLTLSFYASLSLSMPPCPFLSLVTFSLFLSFVDKDKFVDSPGSRCCYSYIYICSLSRCLCSTLVSLFPIVNLFSLSRQASGKNVCLLEKTKKQDRKGEGIVRDRKIHFSKWGKGLP